MNMVRICGKITYVFGVQNEQALLVHRVEWLQGGKISYENGHQHAQDDDTPEQGATPEAVHQR